MKIKTSGVLAALLCTLAVTPVLAAPATISEKPFGELPDGEKVTLWTLTNSQGSKAEIMNYGGILKSMSVRDRRGWLGDVNLGFDTLDEYVKDSPYFGALVGRYSNRIDKGQFTLDGKSYQLATNNGPNHLHGGNIGFDKQVWKGRSMRVKDGVALELRLFSPAAQESFPGNLNMRVLYTLNNDNQLRIDYRAVTDKATPVSLTQHSYFNLAGAGMGTILDHKMMINADRYVPIDATSIPLGGTAKVAGTPFDFRKPTAIGARINNDNLQLKNGAGYDHNFALNGKNGKLRMAARVYSPQSGREMKVYTTEPGLQLYTGNFLKDLKGAYGRVYPYRGGFCLEAQRFPDSPNNPDFPSSILRPGQTYRQTTIYEFSVR